MRQVLKCAFAYELGLTVLRWPSVADRRFLTRLEIDSKSAVGDNWYEVFFPFSFPFILSFFLCEDVCVWEYVFCCMCFWCFCLLGYWCVCVWCCCLVCVCACVHACVLQVLGGICCCCCCCCCCCVLLLLLYCCCFYPFLLISTFLPYGIFKSVVNFSTNSPVSRTVHVACPGGESGRCTVHHGEGAHPDWAVCVFCDDPASQSERLPSVFQWWVLTGRQKPQTVFPTGCHLIWNFCVCLP